MNESDCYHGSAFCPHYHHAIELIGRRWTGAILRAQLSGAIRFSELVHAVPGLSDRLLSERLKELESEGIVSRLVYPETPVRIEYRLTDKGRALSSVIESVSTWAESWGNAPPHQADAGVPTLESASRST
ncbi:MAG: helix-turn-helix transcriptional regulator [Chloroflexota bacterium]|nr:helix-turn-helix transcriptional regulator [Chloroflexota bacterium]